MPPDESPPPPPPSPPSQARFQFSLRWLMIAVTIVAVLLGLSVVPFGRMLLGLLFATLFRGVIPTVAVVGAVYAGGDQRAFAIGTTVACVPFLAESFSGASLEGLVMGSIVQAISIGACGAAAVATRRWLERHGSDQPPP